MTSTPAAGYLKSRRLAFVALTIAIALLVLDTVWAAPILRMVLYAALFGCCAVLAWRHVWRSR